MLSPYDRARIQKLARKDAKDLEARVAQNGLTDEQLEDYFRRLAAKFVWRAEQIRKARAPVKRPDPQNKYHLGEWYVDVWGLPKLVARRLQGYELFPNQLRQMSEEEIRRQRIGPKSARLIYDAARSHPVYTGE